MTHITTEKAQVLMAEWKADIKERMEIRIKLDAVMSMVCIFILGTIFLVGPILPVSNDIVELVGLLAFLGAAVHTLGLIMLASMLVDSKK